MFVCFSLKFIHLFLTVVGLCCCTWAVCSRDEQGLLCVSSLCGGFSCCGT